MRSIVEIRKQLLEVQTQLEALLDELADAENASPNLIPAETIKVPDPNGARHMIFGWLGIKAKPGEDVGELHRYRFDDGPLGPLMFQTYPRSNFNPDWDVIARGCKDATGELYAPYNYPSYKPAWNWLDFEGNIPADEVVEQRYKDYKGGLRAPVTSWPEKYQAIWNKVR